MERINKRFGQVLRERRIALKISQETLADKAGVHRNSVGPIERCERNVSLSVMAKLARALGVPLSQLIREAEGG